MTIKSITIAFDSFEEFDAFNDKFFANLQCVQTKGRKITASYKNVDLHISEVTE